MKSIFSITISLLEILKKIRDCKQIMILYVKWPSPPLFLMDNIKQDGISIKIKCKGIACFTLYFKIWEDTSVRGFKIQLHNLLFIVVLHQVFYQQISFFTAYQNFIQHYLKKDCRKFSFFCKFTQPPTP